MVAIISIRPPPFSATCFHVKQHQLNYPPHTLSCVDLAANISNHYYHNPNTVVSISDSAMPKPLTNHPILRCFPAAPIVIVVAQHLDLLGDPHHHHIALDANRDMPKQNILILAAPHHVDYIMKVAHVNIYPTSPQLLSCVVATIRPVPVP